MTWTAFFRSSLSSSSTADMKNIAHLLEPVIVGSEVRGHRGSQHVAVARAGREQSRVSAFLDDPTLVEQDNPISERNGRRSMRDHDRRAVTHHFRQRVADL